MDAESKPSCRLVTITLSPVDAPVRTLITDVPEPHGHPESTDLRVIRTIRDAKRTHKNKLRSKHTQSVSLSHCSRGGGKTPGDTRLPQQTSGDVLDQVELMERHGVGRERGVAVMELHQPAAQLMLASS